MRLRTRWYVLNGSLLGSWAALFGLLTSGAHVRRVVTLLAIAAVYASYFGLRFLWIRCPHCGYRRVFFGGRAPVLLEHCPHCTQLLNAGPSELMAPPGRL